MIRDPGRVAAAWRAAQEERLHAMAIGDKFYVAPPSGRAFEASLCLFLDEGSCLEWCERMSLVLPEVALKAEPVTLAGLFDLLPTINEQSKKAMRCPIRLDLCGIDHQGWPVLVDVLWSEKSVVH